MAPKNARALQILDLALAQKFHNSQFPQLSLAAQHLIYTFTFTAFNHLLIAA